MVRGDRHLMTYDSETVTMTGPVVKEDRRPVVKGDRRPVVKGDRRPVVKGDRRPVVVEDRGDDEGRRGRDEDIPTLGQGRGR